MARKNYTVEQIIIKLREVELQCNQGKTITEACRGLGITEQTYYRWRKEYGGIDLAPQNRASYNVRKKRKKTNKGAERRWQERTSQSSRSSSSYGK